MPLTNTRHTSSGDDVKRTPIPKHSRGIQTYSNLGWVTAVCLFLVLVSACAVATPTPTITPTPAPTRVRVTAGQTIPLPIEPRAGPTEEYPTITLHATITDELRNTPVQVRRVILGGKEIAKNVNAFDVQLPGDIRDTPLLLQVEAEGYEPWALVLRHKVNYSRHLYWEITLKPTGTSG